MASSTKLVCFFFLFTTLQIHARDSQFFSKVTRNRDFTTNPNHNYYNNQENEVIPFPKQQQEEEQPSNIPQTTQTSYGLYGHESGLDPPSTTTTTATTTTPSTLYNMDDNKYENQNYNKSNNNYDNYENNQEEKSYEPEFETLSETSYTNNNNVAPRKYVAENNYNKYNNNNNGEGKYYAGVGYNGGVEKQGMSDTRYLENGKYFYDIHAEKKLDPINNDFSYYNNNNNNNNLKNGQFYGNNNNYYNGNGMQQGYKNQFPEDEFDFDDQP